MLSIFMKAYYALRRKPAPYYAKYSLLYLAWKTIRKFINVVLIPNTPVNYLRILGYRLIGFRSASMCLSACAAIWMTWSRRIRSLKTMSSISYGCYFAIHGPGQKHTCIRICEGAYVGMASIIISGKNGIELGKDSVVGAGALVNRSVPPGCVAAGVPAKIIKSQKHEDLSVEKRDPVHD